MNESLRCPMEDYLPGRSNYSDILIPTDCHSVFKEKRFFRTVYYCFKCGEKLTKEQSESIEQFKTDWFERNLPKRPSIYMRLKTADRVENVPPGIKYVTASSIDEIPGLLQAYLECYFHPYTPIAFAQCVMLLKQEFKEHSHIIFWID